MRAELEKRGYDSELVEVDVMGSRVGLNLSDPNVGEKVLAACRVRLAEPGMDCVHLFFGSFDEVMVEKDDTVESLKAKMDRAHGQGHTKIEGYGS
ncbi:MAG: hypothetical protein WBE86_00575 [Candidatus Acidiferrales bacterium]